MLTPTFVCIAKIGSIFSFRVAAFCQVLPCHVCAFRCFRNGKSHEIGRKTETNRTGMCFCSFFCHKCSNMRPAPHTHAKQFDKIKWRVLETENETHKKIFCPHFVWRWMHVVPLKRDDVIHTNQIRSSLKYVEQQLSFNSI